MLRPGVLSSSFVGELALAASPDASSIRAILLDVEGTTTPIDFVYRTLFPYARRQAGKFLSQHGSEASVRQDVDGLRVQHQADAAANLEPPFWASDSPDVELTSAVNYAHWLMDRDSKCAPLKSLQGKIWQEGYAGGELRGQVFPDVPLAMSRWSRQGKRICIYSSGSVLAQKLLFATTAAGDLTRWIHAHFDTSIGAKAEPQSYSRIADSLALAAPEIVFISDVPKELDAAREAGMQTALCVRDARPQEAGEGHPIVRSFDALFP